MTRRAGLLCLVLLGCGVEAPCPRADLAPLAELPAYAVVTSDYQSTAIALLDAEGELLDEAWIDSGTTEPGIVATLSGDVVLPTELWPGELVLIDRGEGVDRFVRIALPNGRVLGQHLARLPHDAGGTGFYANPHDVLRLSASRALVSRHQPNHNRGAPELNRGSDLVVVDLNASTLEERIALDAFDLPGEPYVYARPDEMVRVGRFVVVGLDRMSLGWEAGDGATLVVDPDAGTATEVSLGDLQSCGTVARPHDAPDRVVVLCSGPGFAPGTLDAATEAMRRPHAGIAMLRIGEDGTGTVEHLWRADDRADGPLPGAALVPLGGTRVVFASWGDRREGTPDRVHALDLATGETTPVLETEPFAVGRGRFDPDRRLLLLPDAAAGIRRLDLGPDGTLTERPPVDPSPCRRLPPRELAPLASR